MLIDKNESATRFHLPNQIAFAQNAENKQTKKKFTQKKKISINKSRFCESWQQVATDTIRLLRFDRKYELREYAIERSAQ